MEKYLRLKRNSAESPSNSYNFMHWANLIMDKDVKIFKLTIKNPIVSFENTLPLLELAFPRKKLMPSYIRMITSEVLSTIVPQEQSRNPTQRYNFCQQIYPNGNFFHSPLPVFLPASSGTFFQIIFKSSLERKTSLHFVRF